MASKGMPTPGFLRKAAETLELRDPPSPLSALQTLRRTWGPGWANSQMCSWLGGVLVLSHHSCSLCLPPPSKDSLCSSEGKPACQEVIWAVGEEKRRFTARS